MPPLSGMPVPASPRHSRFWYADGNLSLQIGVTQYKLHRYLFNKAKCFPAMSLGTSWFNGGSHPFYLAENSVDFDRFLSVLYPSDYSEHECKTVEEWSSVLILADKWQMDDVRRLAINHLAACAGPVDKIALGHRCNVHEWLAPAYLALAARREPITSEEGAKMGVEALVRIGALVDEVFGNITDYVDQNKFAEFFATKLSMY
ncbi:hypothetical protein B0H17DRAFT_947800 [Mycena rosella]|uniref:BTB domain-containing protein n=1 Tax=Mycena rosella TaxID=1033263 RepID=A0AAD7D0K2_MYCRO|nr:hypothetical protein B0H17DRAFT_947800 [Mycena rosella]